MTVLFRLMKWIMRAVAGVVAILLVLAIAVILFVGLVPAGGRMAADTLSSLISTPDQTIRISRLKGVLTGRLRIEGVSLSDRQGTFGEIRDIAVDWSPLALLTATFHAEKISIQSVSLTRAPAESETAADTTSGGSGFSLPVELKIDRFELPDIRLAEALAGRDFSLAASGAVDATSERVGLNFAAHRQDLPDAMAQADIVYAPAQNELKLQASVAEPQGGLIARLLRLPGNPSVAMTLDGSGPLSNWTGDLDGKVDGAPVISVNGKHTLTDNGRHRLQLTGGGQLQEMLPPALRPFFSGITAIDIATRFGTDERIDIEKGNISTGAVKVSASGALDQKGDNSLTASIAGANGPVAVNWPLQRGQQARLSVDNVNFTLTGAATSARFNATAAIRSAELPQGRFEQVRLQAESEDLDLVERAGSVRSRLTIGRSAFVNADLDRVIRAPFTLDAPIRLALPAIGLDAATLESVNLNGTISGAYDLSKQAVTGNIRMTANPAVLPPAVAGKFSEAIGVEAYVNAVIGGRMALENLTIRSGTVEGHGNAVVENQTVNARLAGRLPDLGKFRPDAKGAAGYDISASGPLEAMTVKGVVNSAEARLSGRMIEALSINLDGTADLAAPRGRIGLTTRIDGKQVNAASDVAYVSNRLSASNLELSVGANKLTGALDFSEQFLPQGDLDFDFPEIALLASFAGQQARGDLRGTLNFVNAQDRPSLSVKANGNILARGGLTVTTPSIDLAMPDLRSLSADGTIRAAGIGIGTQALTDVTLQIRRNDEATLFDLKALLDNAPLSAAAAVTSGDRGTAIAIDHFTARPRSIDVALARPSRILWADGRAAFSQLTLQAGNGRVTLDGEAGNALNLTADVTTLPATLANAFVPEIDAAGAISGKIEATGTAAAPVVRYDLQWSDAQLRQTRAAGIAPLLIEADGRFENNVVTFGTTRITNPDGLSLAADGTLSLVENGPGLDVTVDVGSLPARIADGFRPGLDASGTISGSASVKGVMSAPTADFNIHWHDAQTAETRRAGLSGLTVETAGRFENNTLTIADGRIAGPGRLGLSARGSIGLGEDRPIDLNGELADIPAALANAFVPDLDAAGLLTGRLAARGTLAAPTATFDLTLRDAALRQTRAADIGPLQVATQGRLENNRVTLNRLSMTGQGVDLSATGWLDPAGERPFSANATISALPARLANAFRPGLNASGSLSGRIEASGTLSAPNAVFDVSGSGLALGAGNTALTGLAAHVAGRMENQVLTLETASLNGPENLSLTARGNAALSGERKLDMAADLASVPLALANLFRPDLEASGTISGSVVASGTIDAPTVRYDLATTEIGTRQIRQAGVTGLQMRAKGHFENATATLEETRLTGSGGLAASASGRVILGNAQQGGTGPQLDINADIAALPANLANGFVPGLDAGGMLSGKIASTGTAEAPAIRYDLRWADLAVRQTRAAGLNALQLAASGTFENGTFRLENGRLSGPSGLALDANGSVSLAGERAIDVTANIASLPASLAQSFVPGVEAGGQVTGTVAAGGTIAAPAIRYDLQWSNAEIRRQGAAGISGMNLKAAGTFENNTLTLGETRLTGPQGMSLVAGGRVVLGGNAGPVLDVNADIKALPASLANGFLPDLEAGGRITGKVTALSSAAAPGVRFDLAWDDAALKQTRAAGLAPFRITANGRFENNTVTVDTRLSGQSGLAISGSGSVGLAGDRALNLKINGGVPFALLGAQLSGQGFVLEGKGTIDVTVGGTVAAPLITGSARTSGSRLIDVRRNLALENLNASIDFNRDQATISSATASLSTGGTVSARGTIGINPAAGLPADLTVTLAKATYVDGQLLSATADGQLTVTGPLLSNAVLGGRLNLSKTSITVPAKLPSSLAQINIRQKNAPADVRRQMAAIQPKGGKGTTSALGLDLVISAPTGIFVRGRGIDAELGGELTVTGTSAAPNVAGGFEMRRGRIIILTKRLDFTEGKITFGGGLIPVLDMEATTTSQQTTITVNVTGVANDPDISFSSSPALPQDEVLARLVFGQSMSKLSPLQIAQLADAVSQLAGGGSNSLLETLRANLGVDDLDINTDSTGQTTVSVGRYLNDRTYLQIEQGGTAGARAVINLDVGRGVKLKAGAGGDGGSAGVFYEKEY
ncbi:translocation/assembly module TamB domain-containing protein [Neorhizobium sp. NPDC001467]|uniref:translocation/assembly module TamB domain-containing protein n=1 Tax=Neorhizobium sp. NPDC001467 TaxID=3390595 RepID=UPI003D045C7B